MIPLYPQLKKRGHGFPSICRLIPAGSIVLAMGQSLLAVTSGGSVRRPTPTPLLPPVGGRGPTQEPVPLEDIRGPLDIPEGPNWILIAICLSVLGLVAALAWWYWKRSGKGRETVGESPDAVALQRLRAAWPMMDAPKAFVFAVSNAVRHYLEDRFGLHAPEQTTEEFLDELRHSRALDPYHQERLAAFLEHSDLIKFAPHAPTQNELEALYESATTLVVETMAQAEAVAAEPEDAEDVEDVGEALSPSEEEGLEESMERGEPRDEGQEGVETSGSNIAGDTATRRARSGEGDLGS